VAVFDPVLFVFLNRPVRTDQVAARQSVRAQVRTDCRAQHAVTGAVQRARKRADTAR
jgi:hypothetical protein